MAVTIQIDMERLNEPAIAKALANLLLAMGGVATTQAKPAEAPAASEAPTAPSAPAAPAVNEAPAAPKAPARTRAAEAPKAAAPAAEAPKAEAPAGGDDMVQRYRDFVANLPERSRKFLELVKRKGIVTIEDAMNELDIAVPKAMGGITGSIGRWAPVRGVPIPYEATTIEGERAWKWVGGPGTGKAGASPKAEAPAGVTPSAAAPVGAKQTSSETEQKTEQTMAPDPAKVDALIEALPERSALFVRTLRQRGVLTMPEVLERFSLAKARAVGGIIDPIQRACEELGMEVPFNSTFAPTGDKAWVWPGSEIRRSEPEPLTLPTFEATAAAPSVADEEGDAERGREAARPGVRVRRRGS